jgi:hypothetical protein
MEERRTDTIPKLDDITYLFDALGGVRDGLTFDEIRTMLIFGRREGDREKLLDHSPGMTALRRLDRREDRSTYWSNARDALRELMRLGMVERTPLPSTPLQVKAHRGRQYALTPQGGDFLNLSAKDPWEFRDRFFQAMAGCHSYLRLIRRRLMQGDLFFPRVRKADLPGNAEDWDSSPPQPLDELAKKLAQEVESEVGIIIESTKVLDRMRLHLGAAWKRRKPRLAAREYSKWVVKTVNDVTVRVLAGAYGVPLDYVTLRMSLSILDQFHVAWQTRSLPDRVGWTAWSVADGEPSEATKGDTSPAAWAAGGDVWLRRRRPADEEVRDTLIQVFLKDRERRSQFELIHVLRAIVCHRLKIHGWVFNEVLRKMHAGTLRHEEFAVNLDRGSGWELPPSEEPFRVGDRAFYIMTLLRRE